MRYMRHINLSTGATRHSFRPEPDVLDRYVPWLYAAMVSEGSVLMPEKDLRRYSGVVVPVDLGLLVNIYAPGGIEIFTIGTAKRARHGPGMWEILSSLGDVATGATIPEPPWCGIVRYPLAMEFPIQSEQMFQVERALAWAVMSRRTWLREQDDVEND